MYNYVSFGEKILSFQSNKYRLMYKSDKQILLPDTKMKNSYRFQSSICYKITFLYVYICDFIYVFQHEF